MTQQEILALVAQQIEDAKNLLNSAKELADSNNVYFDFDSAMQNLYEDVTGDWIDWNYSSC
jgi:hypothetical protein